MSRTAQAAGVQRVVARVNDPVMIPEFKKLGIQPYIPSIAQTVLLSLMVRNPDVYTLLTNVTDDRDIRQVSVRNAGFVGRKVRDVRLPGETLIMSIRRNGDFIIPHGNVELDLWDHLTLVGCPDELDEAHEILS
jgi:CPA2 family monovalent cation:H+ antiporter-2